MSENEHVAASLEHNGTREALDAAAADHEPGVLQFVIERSKKAGNDAFKSGNYKEAAKMYSQAIAGCETDASLFSNRSAAYLALGRLEEALWDAQSCVLLSNKAWAKGFYRLGNAHMAMGKCALAADAFRKGAALAPDSEDMAQRLSQAEEQVKHEQRQAKAQIDLTVKTAIERLKKIRQDRQRQKLLNQFKSAMVAPEYDIEDFEWRPTFLPAMKLLKSRIASGIKGAEAGRPTASASGVSSQQSAVASIVANYVAALADLDGPKRALGILDDSVRLEAYDAGIRNALEEQPGGHILVAGGGTGILALMSSTAPGVGAVTAVERSKAMYAMTKLAVKSNRSVPGVERIRLLDCAITTCRVHGETGALERGPSSGLSGGGEANDADAAPPSAVMPSRADILVTDAIDESVLGQGLMQTLDYAGEHLLAPGARVVPARIRIFGAVAEVGRIGRVRGLDLSPINVYRWYPHHEPIDLHKVPVRLLTKPKELHMVDLQARVDSAAGKAACEDLLSGDYAPQWDVDDTVELDVCQGGIANGIVWWFEADMCPASRDQSSSIVTWSGAEAAAGAAGMTAASPAEAELPSVSSWNQAWQYIDDVEMEHGAKVRVQQDKGQVHFTLADAPTKRVRHNLVPRWHFDMLLDDQRNGAYEAAITSAVSDALAKQDGSPHENKKVAVLDMGAGTGILGMMAARAGATQVIGVEQNGHMADIGEECMVRNGFFGKCIMMDGDVRRLTRGSVPQADGTAHDLDDPVDVVVAEVFDAGLIGEGALHMFAAVQRNLVADSYQLVPAAATVYFQLVEMRTGDVRGFDMSQLNRFRWRPDYEGIDLAAQRQNWTPVSAVHEAFRFDFKNWQGNLQGAEMPCRIQATKEGICNAVAFWFDLDLGAAGAFLSSSPYSDRPLQDEGETPGAPTWPQAVQWIEEKHICSGVDMVVTAKHDTYGITFEVTSDDNASHGSREEASGACGGPLAPLCDPAWFQQYQRMDAFNRQMMKACAQNPLEYRKVAEAAVAVGSRPLDFGLESWKAAEFCAKIMS